MEILYAVGMIAVFVLCLALFFTARRILRSSSLTNGSFGASRMYDVEPEEEGNTDAFISVIRRIRGTEVEPAATSIALEASAESAAEVEADAPTPEWMMAEVDAAELQPAVPYEPVVATQSDTQSDFLSDFKPASLSSSAVSSEVVSSQMEETTEAVGVEEFSDDSEDLWEDSQPSPHKKYNYALECLLLGFSAWILYQTQRSTLRYRLAQTSGDRVA